MVFNKEPFDLCEYKTFDIITDFSYVGEHKNAIVKTSNDKVYVQYYANTGASSAGFRILFNTVPGGKYSIRIKGTLLEGDQAFIYVESFCPEKTLVPRDRKFLNNECIIHEVSFVAISELTFIGVLFYCGDKDYNLVIDEFKVSEGSDDSFGQCPGPYNDCCFFEEPQFYSNYLNNKNPYVDSNLVFSETSDQPGPQGLKSRNKVGPRESENLEVASDSDLDSDESDSMDPRVIRKRSVSTSISDVSSFKKKATKRNIRKCQCFDDYYYAPNVQIISLDYFGASGDYLVKPCCDSDSPEYFLETRNGKFGCCKLWECDGENYVWVGSLQQPFYFFDINSCQIFAIKYDTCLGLCAKLGDKVLDCLTGFLWEYTTEGWKQSSCNLFGPQGPPGPSILPFLDINSSRPCNVFENHIEIIPNTVQTSNAGISIGPKGQGSLSAQKPTPNLTLGGNCRGFNAVDWQMVRVTSTQVASGTRSVIGGGGRNQASGANSTISGGYQNLAGNNNATVGGGSRNQSVGLNSTIGGGYINFASGIGSTIAGGGSILFGGNFADGSYTTIGGGFGNRTQAQWSTVSGGINNKNFSIGGVINGGVNNYLAGYRSNIAGGSNNYINGNYSSILGGGGNTTTQGNSIQGSWSSIIGGIGNIIQGSRSTVGGSQAVAQSSGSFVWADNSVNAQFASITDNEFAVRSQQVRFQDGIFGKVLAAGIPAQIDANGIMGTVVSSIKYKESVENIIPQKLDKLQKLRPVQFLYKNDSQKNLQYGLIAEEVEKIFPELVVYDTNGQIVTLRYEQLNGLLLADNQRMHSSIDQLNQTVQSLMERLDKLEIKNNN